MIASGYSLHLYCDTPECQNGLAQRQGDTIIAPGEYFDEKQSVCYKRAKRAGWLINRRYRTTICPMCAKAGKLPPKG